MSLGRRRRRGLHGVAYSERAHAQRQRKRRRDSYMVLSDFASHALRLREVPYTYIYPSRPITTCSPRRSFSLEKYIHLAGRRMDKAKMHACDLSSASYERIYIYMYCDLLIAHVRWTENACSARIEARCTDDASWSASSHRSVDAAWTDRWLGNTRNPPKRVCALSASKMNDWGRQIGFIAIGLRAFNMGKGWRAMRLIWILGIYNPSGISGMLALFKRMHLIIAYKILSVIGLIKCFKVYYCTNYWLETTLFHIFIR